MSFLAVCDPNWSANAGGGGRGAQNHYLLSGVDGIAEQMIASPQWDEHSPGLLWMWATTSSIVGGDAHALAACLNVRICAGFVWPKGDAHAIATSSSHAAAGSPPTRCAHSHRKRGKHEVEGRHLCR